MTRIGRPYAPSGKTRSLANSAAYCRDAAIAGSSDLSGHWVRGGAVAEDDGDHDPSASDAGLAVADARIEGDVLTPVHLAFSSACIAFLLRHAGREHSPQALPAAASEPEPPKRGMGRPGLLSTDDAVYRDLALWGDSNVQALYLLVNARRKWLHVNLAGVTAVLMALAALHWGRLFP